jgi:hypothetical protein
VQEFHHYETHGFPKVKRLFAKEQDNALKLPNAHRKGNWTLHGVLAQWPHVNRLCDRLI